MVIRGDIRILTIFGTLSRGMDIFRVVNQFVKAFENGCVLFWISHPQLGSWVHYPKEITTYLVSHDAV